MLFHTQFVLAALTGLGVHWKSPPREDAETTWGEAVRRHGVHTLRRRSPGSSAVYWLDAVVSGGCCCRWSGRSRCRSRSPSTRAACRSDGSLRRARLLRIPEESDPPDELRRARMHVGQAEAAPGFVDAVVHPRVNAMVCALSRARMKYSPRQELRRDRAVGEALTEGPHALSDDTKVFLLTDAIALSQLHLQVWTSPAAHPGWLATGRAIHGKLSPAA